MRLVKRIKTAPSTNRSLSTQAISSAPTSPASAILPVFSSPPPPSLPLPLPPAGRQSLAIVASPPPVAPSTPAPPETLDPEKQLPAEGPPAFPAEASADATSAFTPSSPPLSLTFASTTSTSTATQPSIASITSVGRRLRTSMSRAPARENVVQDGGAQATTPAAAALSSPSAKASSTSSRSIRNKAVEDEGNNDSSQPFVDDAAPVTLDAGPTITTSQAILLDTNTGSPATPEATLPSASSGFVPVTVLPGQTPAPSPSSSSSSSRTRTKTKCSSATFDAAKSTAITSTGAISGTAANDTSDSTAADHRKAKGIIAGSIVGAAAAIALLFLLLFFCYRRRKTRSTPTPSSSPTALAPKRRSPYGRFSLHNFASPPPSIPRFTPLAFFGRKSTGSTAAPISEKSARSFPFLRSRSRSEASQISGRAPRAASFSAVRSTAATADNTRRSSFAQPTGFHLPEQSSTEGLPDIGPAFRTLSPVIESPQPTPQTAIAPMQPFTSTLRNPFESPRKTSAAPTSQSSSIPKSNPSLSQPLPPSPTASSASNMLASPTSLHTRSSGVLLPTERARESSTSSSRTISLPPAYPQHSRSASESEAAAIEPVGPWRDSVWSVAPTPNGNTPRGSAGWGGMGWMGQRGSGAPHQSTHGLNGGYGTFGGFVNHRVSKSSSHYTDASEWRETGSWLQTPGPLFGGNAQQQQATDQNGQVPSVPKIPDGINNETSSDAAAAAARAAHQRRPAVRAISGAYIGARGHSRRKSSVGAPHWTQDGVAVDERRRSDEGESGASGASSQVGSQAGSQVGSSIAGGKSGRASENSVATVFRVHPGELVKF